VYRALLYFRFLSLFSCASLRRALYIDSQAVAELLTVSVICLFNKNVKFDSAAFLPEVITFAHLFHLTPPVSNA